MKRPFRDDDLWYSLPVSERVCLRLIFFCMFCYLCVAAAVVFAADDPKQVELLQAALNICQQQTADASRAEINRTAPLLVQIATLQKRVQELEEAAKKKP